MARTTTPITEALLIELRHVGDPEADAVIAAHAAERPHEAPHELVGSIAAHLELPPNHRSAAIRAFLEDHPPLPEWADPRLLAQAADFFALRGLEIGSALFLASLPQAYASAIGARVLVLTGRLVSDPVRRIYETAQFVVDVTAPGGLEPPDGAGYRDIRRVRLMHAAVRHLILADPRVTKTSEVGVESSWDLAAGLPVSQEELLGTLLTFTTVVFETLERQGIPPTDDEAAAYLHLWCVVGYLLGVREDLLPLTLAEAHAVAAMIRRLEWRESADGLVLGRALLGAIERSLPLPLRTLPAAAIRWYNPPEVVRSNGVTGGRLTELGFGPLRTMMSVVGAVSGHDRIVHGLTVHITAAVFRDFLAQQRTGSRPTFRLPSELEKQVRRPIWRFRW